MNPKIIQAIEFAIVAHGDQKRRFSGEPYVTHPIRVMEILNCYCQSTVLLQAAVLHDVLEDTKATAGEIQMRFGFQVRSLVEQVSAVAVSKDGNRAARVALNHDHYAASCAYGAAIKLADFCDNAHDLVYNDPKFARVYMDEARLLLPRLSHAALVPDLAELCEDAHERWVLLNAELETTERGHEASAM